MVDIVQELHDAADQAGRKSGRYIPVVETIERAIREINKMRKAASNG